MIALRSDSVKYCALDLWFNALILLGSALFLDGASKMSSGQVFTVSARLPVSPCTAFRFFTETKYLEAWLTSVAEVENRRGGKYELFWDPGNPEDNSTKGCHITAFDQDRLIAFDWNGPVQFRDFMNDLDPLTHVMVFFAPGSIGREAYVDVTLAHSGWRVGSNWDEAKGWQKRAWEAAFEELKQLAARVSAQSGSGT